MSYVLEGSYFLLPWTAVDPCNCTMYIKERKKLTENIINHTKKLRSKGTFLGWKIIPNHV